MAKIMIADDSDAIRLVLKDILQIGDHEIIGEAIDGLEAISLFKSLNPDVLLLDLAMPKKDGLTVLHEIMPENPNANVILITASDDQKVISSCMAAGAKSYISKPFDFNAVLKSITDVLGK